MAAASTIARIRPYRLGGNLPLDPDSATVMMAAWPPSIPSVRPTTRKFRSLWVG
jgi:hypothetical protein